MKSSKPVRLLVSVRSAEEAVAALNGGADLIDVKEPKRGPLGMADPAVMEEVVRAVDSRTSVSVALGELRDDPPMDAIPQGVTYAKMGLAGAEDGWQKRLTEKFAQAPHVKPIGVIYFNPSQMARPPVFTLIADWVVESNAAGLLIDTYMKDRGNLFERRKVRHDSKLENSMNLWNINDCIKEMRRVKKMIALAGSLSGDLFALAVSLNPDIVAVRGAACEDRNRKKGVQAYRVRALADLITAHNAQQAVTAG